MKVLIVYDSYFGNTEKIARSIGNTHDSNQTVEIVRASDIMTDQLTGAELLIVGSPTRAFRPTKGIMNFLKSIPSHSLDGVRVAAFDTRISTDDIDSRMLKKLVHLFGYAAKPISDRLVKRGGILIIPPEGFYVQDNEGPLKDGEIERAAEWGKHIIAK